MTPEKQSTPSKKRGGARPGAGRPKGVPNKVNGQVKEMILQALEQAGGIKYLADRAQDTPTAFLALVGKVLPLQVTGEDGGAIQFQRIERVIVDPK